MQLPGTPKSWTSRKLRDARDLALERIERRKIRALPRRDERIVAPAREAIVRFPARRIGGHPKRGIHSPQIERGRMAHQGPSSAGIAVFVEIGHRELAQAAIDRIAVTQSDVVALRDRAPRAAAPKERDGRGPNPRTARR